MTNQERERFDALLESVLGALPAWVHDLLAEAPLVVEDHPSPELLAELGMADSPQEELCGLYSGVPLTERSHESGGDLPDVVQVFREGIIEIAGGWEAGVAAVEHEIRITVLHEIGHHFGLDEDDLEALGYA